MFKLLSANMGHFSKPQRTENHFESAEQKLMGPLMFQFWSLISKYFESDS